MKLWDVLWVLTAISAAFLYYILGKVIKTQWDQRKSSDYAHVNVTIMHCVAAIIGLTLALWLAFQQTKKALDYSNPVSHGIIIQEIEVPKWVVLDDGSEKAQFDTYEEALNYGMRLSESTKIKQ